MNVAVGELATFNCSGIGDSLNWTVDGVDVHQMTTEMIEVMGISVVTMKEIFPLLGIYTFNSFVNITANCLSNRTVQCIIHSCPSSFHASSGFLQVEGIIMASINYYCVIIMQKAMHTNNNCRTG